MSEIDAFRPCGTCHACCVDLRIEDKPAGEPCPHLVLSACDVRGEGCEIYPLRPAVCRHYQCLWRLGGPKLLGEAFRPDRCGVVFSARRASEMGLPPMNKGDWLVAVARACCGRFYLHDREEAMEAVRRVRVAGLNVWLDEVRPWRKDPLIDEPLLPPTAAFARRLAEAMNGIPKSGIRNHRKGRNADGRANE